MTASSAFDRVAEEYDRTFSRTELGRLYRRAVWRRLDARFAAGDRVLELNCGTGEDAVYLAARGVEVLATDVSPAMLAQTARKAAAAGLDGRIRTARLDLEDVSPERASELIAVHGAPFDGALSNFGGLNCVANLGAVARFVASLLHPAAPLVLCLMGKFVPWEWVWHLARPEKALRRLRRGGAMWRGIRVYYPTIGEVKQAFARHFALERAAAIGALLPPPYAEGWARRFPRIVRWLDALERRVETVPPLPWLADHYLLEFERR